MKRLKIPSFLAALVLAASLVACSGNTGGPTEATTGDTTDNSTVTQTEEVATSEATTGLTSEEQAQIIQALLGGNLVNNFITDEFYDGTVTNEEEAKECIQSVLDRIGGDSTTDLLANSIRMNGEGTKVYTFTQRAGEVTVFGSTVKVVVDSNDSPIALVSSIMPNVQFRPIEEWSIDDKGAEQIVMDLLASQGSDDTLVEGATEAVIIPMPHMQNRLVCSWIVYTFEAGTADGDDNTDCQVYTAHYVTADGEYLYSMNVSEPGNADAVAGQSAKNSFDFDAYEPGQIEYTLQLHDGTKNVTLPVLTDTSTGKSYLADAERKVLCADYAAYKYEGKMQPIEASDDTDPIDANVYYTFARVWDFYNKLGWTGPDGEGTPSLLLMNYVDMDGNPVFNAYYDRKENGFQEFAFTRAANFGECVDVVGHEYTHCVTSTTMTSNIYANDQGAINEAMSDIMGNLIEMRLDGEGGAWTIAENIGQVYRNMADPHESAQPEFAFDTYYAPHPPVTTQINDQGGVHTNSSMLNLVSYKLYQAGMEPRDQGYFWLNVAMVMSPQSDYPMLSEMLPWVMSQLGYDKFVAPLEEAIAEGKFTVTEAPDQTAEDCGTVTFDFADIKELSDSGLTSISFYKAPNATVQERADTWPVAQTTIAQAALPAGDYYVVVNVGNRDGSIEKFMILSDDGWKAIEDHESDTIQANGKTVTVEAGQTLEVTNDGFGPLAIEQFQLIQEKEAQLMQASAA